MQVKDKIALVTGGGVGAGRAIAFALAHEGCHVAVNYSRSEGQAMATAEALRETGVRAMAVKGRRGRRRLPCGVWYSRWPTPSAA